MKNKLFHCKLPGKSRKAVEAPRADSAALKYVKEEVRSPSKKRFHYVEVSGPGNKAYSIPILETRRFTIYKKRKKAD